MVRNPQCCIFLDKCKTKGIKFLKLKYKKPDTVSTTRRKSSGQLVMNWTGYADDLMVKFDDKGSLQRCIMLLNEIDFRSTLPRLKL